ncbi:type IV pilus modification protein PilV [Pseudomonas borbori]
MMIAKFDHYSKGSSLIEVLITLLIFVVGLLGFAGLQLNALQSTADSSQRSQAVWISQELAERMRSNAEAGDAVYTAVATNCATLPARMCADYFDPISANKVNAADCNAAQMAAFDLWEAQCAYSGTAVYQANPTAANGRYNSRDFLTRPAGATPPLALQVSGTRLSITTNWLSTASRSAAGVGAGENLSNRLEVQR